MGNKIGSEIMNLLVKEDVRGHLFDQQKAKKSKEARYIGIMRGINISSFSTFGNLNKCERYFSIKKLELNKDHDTLIRTTRNNIHFAFGHAIETGVQGILCGKTKEQVWFEMFQAWDMGLFDEDKNKSFVDACIAIDAFRYIITQLFAGWEIALFNGKPAIELSLCIDLENGQYYVGHVDVILYNPSERRYRVLEIKTTGSTNVQEAMYKNSDQATGYSVVLDSIAKDLEETATFEVFYLVFATASNDWKLYNFTKSRSNRAGWLNTILLDFQRINQYNTLNFWPKRGSSCLNFGRPCEYLDSCDYDPSAFNPTGTFATVLKEEMDKEEFDFRVRLSEILKTQKELI